MKSSKILIFSFVIALVISVCLGACSGKKDKNNVKDTNEDKEVVSSIVDDITPTGKNFTGSLNISTVGQVVTFGKYEQDNDTANGAEAIDWIVLDIQGDYALVISQKVLDAKAFSADTSAGVTWADSSIRAWLCGDFMSTAFTEDERNRICTINQDDNKDTVFLLSVEDAEKYFESDSDRVAVATAYATSNGVYASLRYTEDKASFNGACRWWLRTADSENALAQRVRNTGDILHVGIDVTSDDIGVRPAMWIEKK